MAMIDVPVRNGAQTSDLSPSLLDDTGPEDPHGSLSAEPSPVAEPSAPAKKKRRVARTRWGNFRSRWDRLQERSGFDLTEADQAARRAVAFFRGMLVAATVISIVANVANAWLTAPLGLRVGAAIAALVPPVFLFVQTHAVFLTIRARRFGPAFWLSLFVTIVIAAFAFKLSYGTIRNLVIMLGTPIEDAGLWPLVIDLSVVGSTVSLFAMSRRLPPPPLQDEHSGIEEIALAGVGDGSALSPTERRMLWDRAASVVKERNPEVNAISTRPVGQIADVLRMTHDDRMLQRDIVDITGLGVSIVRVIQRAGADVLLRTDPKAIAEADR
ncbi:hypothetical protein ACNQVK_04515 [Mycobacterium sp. 134]|uniref:hypothetical protein n=1 Tax=Mycobacteriaceae TaxID=1762 RepID=UPI003AB0EB75